MTPRQAAREHPEVVAATLATAGLAWWTTASQMAGMNAGPGTDLGALGWFTGVWALMMAAMMLPSFAPTAAAYAALAHRAPGRVLLFAERLAWHSGGRWLAAGVLVFAALYQLTPYKRASLLRCRSPLRSLRATWREGRSGAFVMGSRNGGWCLGGSWALMAALFALGVMSLTWMALIAGLVALEKVGPWPRRTRVATAGLLLVLAVAMLAGPHSVPGFVVPGSSGSMHAMRAMGAGAG